MKSEANKRVSGRVAMLREDVMARRGSFLDLADANPFVGDVALWRGRKPGMSVVQWRAAALLELVRGAQIGILSGWRLAGEHVLSHHGVGFSCRPESAGQVHRLAELGVPPEKAAEIREAVKEWAGPRSYAAVGETYTDPILATEGWTRVCWGRGWTENHSVRDYAKMLRLGYAGVRREIEERRTRADIGDPEFLRQDNFWKAALTVCDAGILLGRRYAELAGRMAAEARDPEGATRLKAMAAACAQVPEHGTRTLREAVQALWFGHILTCGEDGINANSIGRLDQILHPYYRADLDAGRITPDDACELMEELACKLYLDYDVQAITLGGSTRDGRSAVNDLSTIILDATRNVDFVRDVSVRLDGRTPSRFVDLCAGLVARGGGIPFFFNDACFIPALTDRGISLEDARDYAPIGCIELTIPGRANPHAVSGLFNSAKCLELALFNGRDPQTGQQAGPATGMLTDFNTYDDVIRSYCAQVEFFAKWMVYLCNRGELAQRERGPLPCWSTLTDACIERGRDITDRGALYNYHSICFVGTANTADSLMALRKLVFDEKRIDRAQLLDALRADFEGQESLRQFLLRGAPKYGNDVKEVDDIAAWTVNHFIDLMDRARSPLGGRYFVHLFSFRWNIDYGKLLGATPDGRRACEPLAYSLSANQGRDEKGVTALLNSIARIPHNRAAGASAAIVELDPKLVEGEAGIQRLSQLIQTAVKMGVGQLQFNVVTAERLIKAQQEPEKYGNIAVRVAGYSQRFSLIDREIQDHIIARTKHTS